MDQDQEELVRTLKHYGELYKECGVIVQSIRDDLAVIRSRLERRFYYEYPGDYGRVVDRSEIYKIKRLVERIQNGERFCELNEDNFY